MRAQSIVGRAARRWHLLVGIRWERWQCAFAARYYQRVTLPLQFWHALGCPSSWRPQLPWWQPFVWRYLVLTDWVWPSRPCGCGWLSAAIRKVLKKGVFSN